MADRQEARSAATVRLPTPKQLVDAAEIIMRWAESRNDPNSQEVTMAKYTADNLRMTALAIEATHG